MRQEYRPWHDPVFEAHTKYCDDPVLIAVDPNVRVQESWTYAGFEDIQGKFAIRITDHVLAWEREDDIVANAWVAAIDWDRSLVYLIVDWCCWRDR